MLALPATPRQLIDEVIAPALVLFPARMDTPSARCSLVAHCVQETNIDDRDQGRDDVIGPATGLWQFELGGAVLGVLRHRATSELAHLACRKAGVPASPRAVHLALLTNDILACQFARLNLWWHPAALPKPELRFEQVAWDLYLETWRPGKPHRNRWGRSWAMGVGAVA